MRNRMIKTKCNALLMLSTLCLFLIAADFCRADEAEQVERSMRFVDQSYNATELYSAGDVEKALAIFQELLVVDGDLDEDGYVAISVGDCLTALGRIEEARDAYHAAVAMHPDLDSEVNQRLIELDLAGSVNDDLIAKLRLATQRSDLNSYTSNLQLGQALEKRAETLMRESIGAFRAALAFGSPWLRDTTQNQIAALEELADDLHLTIDQLENRLNQLAGKKNFKKNDSAEKSSAIEIEKQNWRWNARIDKQPAVSIEIKTDKDGKKEILAGNQVVKLTPAQELLLRRHEQRINQILLEAAGKINKPSENKQ